MGYIYQISVDKLGGKMKKLIAKMNVHTTESLKNLSIACLWTGERLY
jgi:hypothetical protein